MKLIEKAITFAKKWHGTQMRKTGDHPFYFHPLAVAVMVDRLTKVRFEDGKRIMLTLEQTLDKLIKIGDHEALFIKQMDRQHNLETIEGLKPHKQQKMAKETNRHLIKWLAVIGDKLGIKNILLLEDKMDVKVLILAA